MEMNTLLGRIRHEDELELKDSLVDIVTDELYRIIPSQNIASLIVENPTGARKELEHILHEITVKPPCKIIDPTRRGEVIGKVISAILGFGPIDELLEDPSVTEIMVNGGKRIFFERDGRLHRSGLSFKNDQEVRTVIDRIISPLGRRIDERTPMVNARLPQGHRVHAVIPPLSLDGPILTIRKFRDEIFDFEELTRLGTMSPQLAQLLLWLVQARKNMAVTGGTGSGKTTLLNALSNAIDLHERIITIEDSAELKFERHPHVVRLESRPANLEGKGAVTIRELVINSLRMRPDRIVVGEVRGAEALEMLQAMNTGHDGSLTTLHANSVDEAAGRLITMVGYGVQLPHTQVLAQIASAFDVIIHQSRFSDGVRRITDIALVKGISGDACLLERICSYVREGKTSEGKIEGHWDFSYDEKLMQEFVVKGIVSASEVDRWVSQF